MRFVLIALLACFLLAPVVLCGCSCSNPNAALVVRNPVGIIRESQPQQVRKVATWVEPQYPTPAACPAPYQAGWVPAPAAPPAPYQPRYTAPACTPTAP